MLGVGFSNAPAWSFSLSQFATEDERCYLDLAPWDFDGDFVVELAVAAYKYDPINPENSTNLVFILEPNSQGEIVKSWEGSAPTGGSHPGYFTLEWADINCDGNEDLIAGSICASYSDAYLLAYIFDQSTDMLHDTPIILSNRCSWDVTDILWGEFVDLNSTTLTAPDLLLLNRGDNPQVLIGTPTISGWDISAFSQSITPDELVDLEEYPAYTAQPWLIASNPTLLGFYTGSPYALCEVSASYGGDYSSRKLMRGEDYWHSLAIAPPHAASGFPPYTCTLIGGNSWKEGVASYYNLPQLSPTREYLISPGESYNDFMIEFVSDISVFVSHITEPARCFIAMSEAGQLEANDIRNRQGRLVEILLSSEGLWTTTTPVDTEPETSLGPRKEAFSVAWCPFESTVSKVFTFNNVGHSFHLSESALSLTGFEPVYGINSSIIIRNDGSREQGHVWYTGNGIFGISEELNTGDALRLNILTANTAQLVFGRRGIIEAWSVF